MKASNILLNNSLFLWTIIVNLRKEYGPKSTMNSKQLWDLWFASHYPTLVRGQVPEFLVFLLREAQNWGLLWDGSPPELIFLKAIDDFSIMADRSFHQDKDAKVLLMTLQRVQWSWMNTLHTLFTRLLTFKFLLIVSLY